MKLFFMLMIGLIDAKKKGGRKVPPRHPSSRLNRLVNALKRDLRDCAYFSKAFFLEFKLLLTKITTKYIPRLAKNGVFSLRVV